jgi:hypothetical protein
MEKIVNKNGEGKKKLKFMYMEINSKELIQYLKLKLQYFVRHKFVARWQD